MSNNHISTMSKLETIQENKKRNQNKKNYAIKSLFETIEIEQKANRNVNK